MEEQSEAEARPRAFCLMSQRVIECSEVKPIGGAEAKASLNRATSCT